MALLGSFAVWFVLESVFLANPDMPFLRARQMLSFPVGVLLAMMKEKVENALTKTNSTLILAVGGITCLLFMAITQLHTVKEMPYLVSNAMALLTCFPMAVDILVFGKSFSGLFENRMLTAIGSISYELYLVHAFTLNLIKLAMISILWFMVITCVLACILHVGMEIKKNDRFNRCYINKK